MGSLLTNASLPHGVIRERLGMPVLEVAEHAPMGTTASARESTSARQRSPTLAVTCLLRATQIVPLLNAPASPECPPPPALASSPGPRETLHLGDVIPVRGLVWILTGRSKSWFDK